MTRTPQTPVSNALEFLRRMLWAESAMNNFSASLDISVAGLSAEEFSEYKKQRDTIMTKREKRQRRYEAAI